MILLAFTVVVFSISLSAYAEQLPAQLEVLLARVNTITYSPPLTMKVGKNRTCRKKLRNYPKRSAGTAVNYPALVYRCFPFYPRKCATPYKSSDAIELVFDIGIEGVPTNVRIVRTTNECYNRSAARAVAGRRYEPSENGYSDIRTFASFHLN